MVVPGAGIEPARLAAGDFESPASTNFTTRAVCSDAADYGIGAFAACPFLVACRSFAPEIVLGTLLWPDVR